MSEVDFVTLVEDDPGAGGSSLAGYWKVAVIDDDPAVHDGTRFALQDYVLQDRGLDLKSAYSAAEGRRLMADNPDMAVVLLDVVMETEGAGLDLVNTIRNDLANETVRIILRTGQPGQAPERRVVVDYDINDYKAKTELTADKLFTTITSALRSHDQLKRLVETRRGLEMIVEAASTLFAFDSMQKLAEGVLMQIASLIDLDCHGILVLREGEGEGGLSVLAGSGSFSRFTAGESAEPLDEAFRTLLHEAFERRRHHFLDTSSSLYISTGSVREIVVILDAHRRLSATDRQLVEVFCARLSIAFDNVHLFEQLQKANARLERRVERRTRELRGAKERLEKQWERLREANAFKSELLGTVAHDLKNPLSVILGRTEMLTELLQMEPVPEAAGTQVDHIRQSARRLTDMVNSLIADAMADALDISVRAEAFDLSAIVADVVEANRALAAKKAQAITLEADAGLLVTGDQERLREAIDNLLSNAVKYSPPGGEIAVSVFQEAGEILTRVVDEGPGLSPEDFDRVFGRFQRLSAKPTGGENSTGLGLSITKQIVELHNGRIFVEAGAEGRGAVFVIALPGLNQADA